MKRHPTLRFVRGQEILEVQGLGVITFVTFQWGHLHTVSPTFYKIFEVFTPSFSNSHVFNILLTVLETL